MQLAVLLLRLARSHPDPQMGLRFVRAARLAIHVDWPVDPPELHEPYTVDDDFDPPLERIPSDADPDLWYPVNRQPAKPVPRNDVLLFPQREKLR